jgi:hypothetical protein
VSADCRYSMADKAASSPGTVAELKIHDLNIVSWGLVQRHCLDMGVL